ncbi:MAG: 50S ribosomal protein L44e [Candidatus Aenigmatarchaeota archaeon]|nr:MAG: 50S ribosomal protein L44e [Candidatus Aenigmarchaeota archaeon]
MIIPKTMHRYCEKCKKHTEQKVRREKVGATKRRTMAGGQRRYLRLMKGYGGFPRPDPKGREKPTRKVDIRYACLVCKKEHIIGQGFRAKKYEIGKGE